MQSNYEIRKTARQGLSENWGAGVGVTLLYFVLTLLIPTISGALDNIFNTGFDIGAIHTGVITIIINWTVMSLLAVGFMWIFLDFVRGNDLNAEKLFQAFTSKISGKLIIAYILYMVYIILWSLLFIIPGLIKSFSYSQTFYILRDNPDLSANEAITLSRKMMGGNKENLFCLGLSFIGWVILSVFTLGIGFLWLAPYAYTSFALFYENVKKQYENAGGNVGTPQSSTAQITNDSYNPNKLPNDF